MKTYVAKITTDFGIGCSLRVIDIKNCSSLFEMGCFGVANCFKKINKCFIKPVYE